MGEEKRYTGILFFWIQEAVPHDPRPVILEA
jgi:hypothetical protein